MKSYLSPRYIVLALVIIWGGAILGFGLIHNDVLGLQESAAKDLILAWSINDNVISPVGSYGAPDFRAVPFYVVGLYWSGSVLAVKIFTILITFAAAILMFRSTGLSPGLPPNNTSSTYRTHSADGEPLATTPPPATYFGGTEAAAISTALLLISPIIITQIDSIGAGPYLLLVIGFAAFMDKRYRDNGNHLGGWYFIQMLVVALAVSLHPAGLAYPLTLIWVWLTEKNKPAEKKSIIIGSLITTFIVISMRLGWPDGLNWFANPLQILSDAAVNGLSGLGQHANMSIGLVLAGLWVFIVIRDRQYFLHQFSGLLLLFASIIGLVSADSTWALIVMTLLIYRGIHMLVTFNDSASKETLLSKRGFVLAITLFIATAFMLANKDYVQNKKMEMVSPTDMLIRTVCAEAQDLEKPFKAASQWPARTMIACRRDVFPLPRAAESGGKLLDKITGITHMVFDHGDTANQALANNIAELSGIAETIAVQKGGVVIRMRNNLTTEESKHSIEKQPLPQENKQ